MLHTLPPPVSTRIGFNLNTLDLTNEEEFLWLKALIWPEHNERLLLFEQAADYIKDSALHLVEGDGVQLISEHAMNIPGESVICIFHTHVANQIPKEAQKQ